MLLKLINFPQIITKIFSWGIPDADLLFQRKQLASQKRMNQLYMHIVLRDGSVSNADQFSWCFFKYLCILIYNETYT